MPKIRALDAAYFPPEGLLLHKAFSQREKQTLIRRERWSPTKKREPDRVVQPESGIAGNVRALFGKERETQTPSRKPRTGLESAGRRVCGGHSLCAKFLFPGVVVVVHRCCDPSVSAAASEIGGCKQVAQRSAESPAFLTSEPGRQRVRPWLQDGRWWRPVDDAAVVGSAACSGFRLIRHPASENFAGVTQATPVYTASDYGCARIFNIFFLL
ncbi:hypothetical protein MRX96_042948 [Rhipicephalus microplus]